MSDVIPYYPVGMMERVIREGQVPTAATFAHMLSLLPCCDNHQGSRFYELHTLQNQFYLHNNSIARQQPAIRNTPFEVATSLLYLLSTTSHSLMMELSSALVPRSLKTWIWRSLSGARLVATGMYERSIIKIVMLVAGCELRYSQSITMKEN
jgi:hypothetical protein